MVEPSQMDVVLEGGRAAPEIIDNKGPMKEEVMSNKVAIRASLPRQYISQMRGVSLKTQLRLSVETKRSFCKRCDILLVPGVTCIEETQNASRGRRKPWANVHVTRCAACGTEKRIPAQQRGKKLSTRTQEKELKTQAGNG
jgi:ribonuclease P protein subunit RPR2